MQTEEFPTAKDTLSDEYTHEILIPSAPKAWIPPTPENHFFCGMATLHSTDIIPVHDTTEYLFPDIFWPLASWQNI